MSSIEEEKERKKITSLVATEIRRQDINIVFLKIPCFQLILFIIIIIFDTKTDENILKKNLIGA